MIKTYSDLIKLTNFKDRLEYLKLDSIVGSETFGRDRQINQIFYRSREWKKIRDYIIVRDNGCDLGIEGRDIFDKIIIHHMNPINLDDINNYSDMLINPEYLISTSHVTHNAIHYGTNIIEQDPVIRVAGDTCPWKK